MIRYKNFDSESPYNREAAGWARDQQEGTFPLDARPIRDKINSPESLSAEIIEEGIEVVEPQEKDEPQDIVFLD